MIKKVVISRSSRSNPATIIPPSSKSHTMRALLFAGLSNEESEIFNYLLSNDTEAMMTVLKDLGAEIEKKDNVLKIRGVGEKLYEIQDIFVDAKNSGIIFRFIPAILSLSKAKAVITGDASIQNLRSVEPLVRAIRDLKGECIYLKKPGYAPVQIQGPIRPGVIEMEGNDSQPISAMLIACSVLKEKSEIYVKDPKEKPWIDMTLYWLKKLGAEIETEKYTKYVIRKPISYRGFSYHVPTDFSSATFLVAAALICGVKTTLRHLDFEDVQGDKIVIDHLMNMGANIKKDKELVIEPTSFMEGGIIDMDGCIDAIAILAVLGCFMKSPLVLLNCRAARKKESNRLEAITSELKKMGAKIHCFEDRIEIFPSALQGAQLISYKDHRIAMALSVAALGVQSGCTVIEDVDCVAKTYPYFFRDLKKFGADIQWIEM